MTFMKRTAYLGTILLVMVLSIVYHAGAFAQPAVRSTITVIFSLKTSPQMIQFVEVLKAEMPEYSFVFEERPGAGGIVAANAFVNMSGDGTKLMLFGAMGTLVYNDVLQPEAVKYERADLKTISAVYENKEVLVTQTGSSVRTIEDFRTRISDKNARINIGVRTTTDKMVCLNLRQLVGSHIECVDYPNSFKLQHELLGNQIEFGLINYGEALEQPKMQIIASLKKYGPQLKSLADGFPQLKTTYAGLAALALPRAASSETSDFWEKSLMRVMSSDNYKAFVERNQLHMELRMFGSRNFEKLIVEARKNR